MPNRYICTVLDEMRDCFKTFNFGNMRGLIEEAQTLANRMESALSNYSESKYVVEELHDLKVQKKLLRSQVKNLERTISDYDAFKKWQEEVSKDADI